MNEVPKAKIQVYLPSACLQVVTELARYGLYVILTFTMATD